jgi:serine phosphatase RsbU (regulator of sigma subunit)
MRENANFDANVKIYELNTEKELNEQKMKEQKRITTLIIIVLVIGTILLVLTFRSLMQKRSNVKILNEKNQQLSRQQDEIVAQRNTIEEQRQASERANLIMFQSIRYARHIQNAALPSEEHITRIFPDHFVYYEPKDIVSGDFYYATQNAGLDIFVLGDCTGHGVPGGFMSMLGITNLNYIVGRVLDPDRILNKLREAIITDLRQRDDEPLDAIPPTQQDRSRDGMDCAIYVINEKDNTLTFAGANNPLVIIRNNEIIVHKADKMPVGIYLKMEPFTSTEIQLQKGDCLYTFSDGYQDQLNHITKKKFLSIHLRELLLEIHELPMDQQKVILEQTFDDWRGPEEKQVDDVVIFGVRI